MQRFNKEDNLDAWDYAIADSRSLFTAMVDMLCVKAPLLLCDTSLPEREYLLF